MRYHVYRLLFANHIPVSAVACDCRHDCGIASSLSTYIDNDAGPAERAGEARTFFDCLYEGVTVSVTVPAFPLVAALVTAVTDTSLTYEEPPPE